MVCVILACVALVAVILQRTRNYARASAKDISPPRPSTCLCHNGLLVESTVASYDLDLYDRSPWLWSFDARHFASRTFDDITSKSQVTGPYHLALQTWIPAVVTRSCGRIYAQSNRSIRLFTQVRPVCARAPDDISELQASTAVMGALDHDRVVEMRIPLVPW